MCVTHTRGAHENLFRRVAGDVPYYYYYYMFDDLADRTRRPGA